MVFLLVYRLVNLTKGFQVVFWMNMISLHIRPLSGEFMRITKETVPIDDVIGRYEASLTGCHLKCRATIGCARYGSENMDMTGPITWCYLLKDGDDLLKGDGEVLQLYVVEKDRTRYIPWMKVPVEKLAPKTSVKPTTAAIPEYIPLKDAKQNSTYLLNHCEGNKCTANKSLDGDLSTSSVTRSGGSSQWWSAVLVDVSRIERILVYVSSWAFNRRKFNRFKVETKRNTDEKWTVCKDEYKMEAPYYPHIVQCSSPTIAKYIRLSVAGGGTLYLREVKVWGVMIVSK